MSKNSTAWPPRADRTASRCSPARPPASSAAPPSNTRAATTRSSWAKSSEFEQAAHAPLVYHAGRYGGIFPRAPSPPNASEDALAELERQGHVTRQHGQPALTETGRRLAEGLAGLADTSTLSSHEADALRYLLGRLMA